MEKSRKPAKRTSAVSAAEPAFHFPASQRMLLGWIFPALAVGAGLLYALPMAATVGETGFPFDDAYTALAFARNLVKHAAYAAHPSGPATAGPTAPLQVFLLALTGMMTGDGVSANFALGIASFAAVAGLTFLLGLRLFRDREWLAAVAALIIVSSPHMASAAVAGLPTMLFTSLTLASAYFYFARRTLLFFLFAGLALWTHPAALVFLLAAIVHLLYSHRFVKPEFRPVFEGERATTRRETAVGGILYFVLAAGYAAFNLALSGSFFVNPVAAKLRYYADARFGFLSETWRFFTQSWEAALVLFATFSLVLLGVDVLRRRSAPLLICAAFVVGMIAAYGLIFPVILDHHTLLPTLPFFALLGVWGLQRAFDLVAAALPSPLGRSVSLGFVAAIVATSIVLSLVDWDGYRNAHFRAGRYVLDRQIAAGRWIAANTPADAHVATHFPGTVSYYGNRAVLDFTGKLTPSVVERMGNMAALVDEIRGAGVTFVAAQRDAFEVVNTNPIFTSDPAQPGVTEVFAYVPGRTHLMSQTASALNTEAVQLMGQQRWSEAAMVLQRSFEADPLSCRTSTLYGIAALQQGDTANARTYLSQALILHAEYAPAMVPLGDILIAKKEYNQGLRLLDQALSLNPRSAQAQASLRAAQQARRKDSLEAHGIHEYTLTR